MSKPTLPPAQLYRLDDQDKGGSRMIARDDPQFKKFYVDENIKNIVSDYDQQMMDRITMTIVYEDGRTISLPMGNMPLMYKANLNGESVTMHTTNPWALQADHYVRKSNIIYPVDAKGHILFTSADTPNIVNARSQIYNYVQQAAQLVEIAETVNSFAGSVARLGSYAAQLKSFTWVRGIKVPKPTFEEGSNPKPRVTTSPLPGEQPPGGGGKGSLPDEPAGGGGGRHGGGGGGSGGDEGGKPPFRVIQGGRTGPPTFRISLTRILGYLKDRNAFQSGKPTFKSISEFDDYWRKQQGFKLLKNDPFGPPGGRQFIYLGPDDIVIKVKTAGYSGGKRQGIATMSLEVTNGKGVGWEHTRFKVDADGKIVAKNMHVDGEIVSLPADHPGRRQNPPLEFGFLEAGKPPSDDQGRSNIKGLTGLELVDNQSTRADQQVWADRGHLDLPQGFNGAGAESIEPDRQ
jgi:hypothetical protein